MDVISIITDFASKISAMVMLATFGFTLFVGRTFADKTTGKAPSWYWMVPYFIGIVFGIAQYYLQHNTLNVPHPWIDNTIYGIGYGLAYGGLDWLVWTYIAQPQFDRLTLAQKGASAVLFPKTDSPSPPGGPGQ